MILFSCQPVFSQAPPLALSAMAPEEEEETTAGESLPPTPPPPPPDLLAFSRPEVPHRVELRFPPSLGEARTGEVSAYVVLRRADGESPWQVAGWLGVGGATRETPDGPLLYAFVDSPTGPQIGREGTCHWKVVALGGSLSRVFAEAWQASRSPHDLADLLSPLPATQEIVAEVPGALPFWKTPRGGALSVLVGGIAGILLVMGGWSLWRRHR